MTARETPAAAPETDNHRMLRHLLDDVHDVQARLQRLEDVVAELAPHARRLVALQRARRRVVDYLATGAGNGRP